MLLTLLKALDTADLMAVVKNMAMSPLDIDLILYAAIDNGEVEVDKEKNTIKALKEPVKIYYDPLLASKLVEIIKRYDKQKANITYNRLMQDVLAPGSPHGYPVHDFACTLYALENNLIVGYPKLNRYEIDVPEIKNKRPYNKYVFYTYLDHQEFGAKAINQYIEQWQKINLGLNKKSKK